MNRKPKVCDECGEKDELRWSDIYGGWICDLCQEAIEEDEILREHERDEEAKYLFEEEEQDDTEE